MKPQLPGMMFLISSSEPNNPSKPHGKSPDPALSRHFYQDNSLIKATKSKISFKAKISQLHPKELELSKQSLITAKYSSARAYQEKVEEIISNSYKIHNLSILKLHQSAIKIQKHVKGYLARKRFEDLYLEYKENQLEYLTNFLENLSFQTFFKLGTNTLPAILKIQRFYRRCCFNHKISKLTQFYQVYTAAKKKNAEVKARPCLQVLVGKFKADLQVEITRKARVLHKVRRNLAVISITLYWKKRRLTYKSFREKIQKVKRRLLALKAREAYQKSLKSNPDEQNSRINEDELDNLLDENQRLKKLQKEKERIKRAKKIQEAKLAYGINSIKLQSYSPLIPETFDDSPATKDPEPRISMTIASLQHSSQRAEPFNTRCTQISIPVPIRHKHLYSQNPSINYSLLQSSYTNQMPSIRLPSKLNDANFTRKTKSFEQKHQIYEPVMRIPESITKPARQKYLNKETIAFSLKRREILPSYSGPTWNISSRVEDEYVPSILSSFTPQPYQDSPNKRPAAKEESTNYSKAGQLKQRIRECSSSLLTNQISTQEASTIDLIHN